MPKWQCLVWGSRCPLHATEMMADLQVHVGGHETRCWVPAIATAHITSTINWRFLFSLLMLQFSICVVGFGLKRN